MTKGEESAVIARVLDGDADAFEPLVTANQKRIYNLVFKMLGNSEDAFDVSQEVFVKAFRSLSTFKGESSFSSWLYRIAANMSINYMRKNRKRYSASIVYIDDLDTQRELELPDIRCCPEAECERRELRQEINKAITMISTEQRSVLVMREIGGMSYAEIAEALKLEPGTVKSRIFRARAALAKALKERGTFSDK